MKIFNKSSASKAVIEGAVDTAANAAAPPPARTKFWKAIIWIKDTAIECSFWSLVVYLLFGVIFSLHTVSGASMENTAHDGDFVLGLRLDNTPEYGDIITFWREEPGGLFFNWFESGHQVIIKRVIGMGGDVIDIDPVTATVYRNGVALDEPYLGTPTTNLEDMTGPVTIPEGYYFVMGDNRQHSGDSRSKYIGLVPKENIISKVIFI